MMTDPYQGAEFALYHRQTYRTLYRDENSQGGILEPSDGIKYLEAPTDNDMYIKSEWKKAHYDKEDLYRATRQRSFAGKAW